jgi:hypothetical protein
MTKGKDLIPGEHKAKDWFIIMAIKNRYFWFTILGLGLLICQLINLNWCIDVTVGSAADGAIAFVLVLCGMLIPLVLFLTNGIFLITFWRYLKGEK